MGRIELFIDSYVNADTFIYLNLFHVTGLKQKKPSGVRKASIYLSFFLLVHIFIEYIPSPDCL